MPPPQPQPANLASLPGHLVREIGLHLYNPLHLTQQDRLTWSIFSTVDMDPPREQGLNDLVNLSLVCSKIRKDIRRILFRCVRVHGLEKAKELIEHRDDWGHYVKSLILDMAMFDPPEAPTPQVTGPSSPVPIPPKMEMEESESDQQAFSSSSRQESNSNRPEQQSVAFDVSTLGRAPNRNDSVGATPTYRNPWNESQTLITMLHSLPNLQHLSLFADNSDDITLSLVFSDPKLVSHLAPNMLSFGWRQRGIPPEGFREFSNATMFVSILGWLRQCGKLSFLVLDADMGGMKDDDLFQVMEALEARKGVLRERAIEAARQRLRREKVGLGSAQERPNGTATAGGETSTTTAFGEAAASGKRKRRDSDYREERPEKRLVGSDGKATHVERMQPTEITHRQTKKRTARVKRPDITPSKISLMICGPIAGWEPSREAMNHPIDEEDEPFSLLEYASGHVSSLSLSRGCLSNGERILAGRNLGKKPRPPVFLDRLIDRFSGIKELFIDRPIRSREHGERDTLRTLVSRLLDALDAKGETLNADVARLQEVALAPLIRLTDLTLLQVGGYALDEQTQIAATHWAAWRSDSLAICGWMGLEGETNWLTAARQKWFDYSYPTKYFKPRPKAKIADDETTVDWESDSFSEVGEDTMPTSPPSPMPSTTSKEPYPDWDEDDPGFPDPKDFEVQELGDAGLSYIYDLVDNYNKHLAPNAPMKWREPERRYQRTEKHSKPLWRMLPKPGGAGDNRTGQ